MQRFKIVIECALISAVAMSGWVHAQPGGEPQRKKPDGSPFHKDAGDEGRFLPLPKPFLMAGDERFEEVLRLALVPEDQLEAALATWTEKRQLDERARKIMMRRLDSFRRRLRDEALQQAQLMDLKLTENQQSEFIRDYWTRRAVIERAIRQNAEAELKSEMERSNSKLKKDWQSAR